MKGLVNSSKQAIRIRSGVAGLSRGNQSVRPSSALAATMASLMAKKTHEARKKGGSPTAFDEWIAFGFGASYQTTYIPLHYISYIYFFLSGKLGLEPMTFRVQVVGLLPHELYHFVYLSYMLNLTERAFVLYTLRREMLNLRGISLMEGIL